ncbi:adenylyltransferase/cytidyltransferase family protein [Paraneptunicella aestuarii]|uniref:PfkB family carbohydrate kinase n=1 Tax=Paraneptunicella aestuarii TaxID=2831148 RepID=UPI001E59A02D|nr:PfkB family carbohydrate kinase [Paraneptunicella aestuarii]UAA39537.1 adenylyltransferase/cytidyltransferase family protein [Paraneptunicella aestuarii]
MSKNSNTKHYNNKKSRVFISGIFNVLHPGHIRLFKFASELADEVVVGLQMKTEHDHNMLDDNERLQALQAVSLVNNIVLIHDLVAVLNELKPDLVLKGSEFKHRDNIEESIVQAWGGKLVFSSGENQFYSEKFIHRNGYKNEAHFPTAYRNYITRHQINRALIEDALSKISATRVAVIGDIILDEYIDCDPVGLSREDPTIVVTPTDSNLFVGGAAIVAQHTRTLGANVDFYSVAGVDSSADWLETEMSAHGVNTFIYQDDSRPTTVKRRYRTQNKTLLRVNEYRSHSLAKNLQKQLLEDFERNIDSYDLVVFSDFSYGLLTTNFITQLQAIAKAHGVNMVADSQTSSQRGDLSKFKDLMLVTPTEIEARLAVDNHDNDIGLAVVIEDVARQLRSEHVIITLSADGALMLDFTDPSNPRLDSLPALNKNPVDVSGAGDLLLITTSLLKQIGCDLWHASLMGMVASAIHISQVGNKPIDMKKVRQYLDQI